MRVLVAVLLMPLTTGSVDGQSKKADKPATPEGLVGKSVLAKKVVLTYPTEGDCWHQREKASEWATAKAEKYKVVEVVLHKGFTQDGWLLKIRDGKTKNTGWVLATDIGEQK